MIHGVNILFWNIIAGWKTVRIARKKKKNDNGATFQIHYLSFRLKMLAESFLAEYKFKLKLPGRNKKKKKKGQKLSRKRSIRASLSHISSNRVPSIFLALMLPLPRTNFRTNRNATPDEINRRYNSASGKCQNVVARRPNRDVNRSVDRLTMYPALYQPIYTRHPRLLPL